MVTERDNPIETAQSLRNKIVDLRDSIARINVIKNFDKLKFPLSGHIYDVIEDVPEFVIIETSISEELQNQTPHLKDSHNGNITEKLVVLPFGGWGDEASEYDDRSDLRDILLVYAFITRQDYRFLSDEHCKNGDLIFHRNFKDKGKLDKLGKEEYERFGKVKLQYFQEHELELLRSLSVDMEKALERIYL